MILLAYKVQMLFGERHSWGFFSAAYSRADASLEFRSFLAAHRRGTSHFQRGELGIQYGVLPDLGNLRLLWFRYSETKQNSKFVRDPKYADVP